MCLPLPHHFTVGVSGSVHTHTAEPYLPTRTPTCLSGWLQSMCFWVGVARFGVQLLLGPLLEGSVPTLTCVHVKSVGIAPIPPIVPSFEGVRHCRGRALGFPLLPRPLLLPLGRGVGTAVHEQGLRGPPVKQGLGSSFCFSSQRGIGRCFVFSRCCNSQIVVFLTSFCMAISRMEATAALFTTSLNRDVSVLFQCRVSLPFSRHEEG